jgi:mRNA interferase RelE/StbE
MGPYSLVFKTGVEKDSRKIPKDLIPHIFEYIEKLAVDPVPDESYKLTSAENLYRIRVGDYRVIYQVLHVCPPLQKVLFDDFLGAELCRIQPDGGRIEEF